MSKLKLSCLTLLFLLSLPSFAQNTIHVPADQPTIQAGIDAAASGDTVLVAPGTYTENIDFKGKGITVTSGARQYSEAAATIITAAAPGSVVVMEHGEPATAILNGFTIQNGHSIPHSTTIENNGIALHQASPVITNNIISNNTGCGILVSNQSAPLIQGNDITNNVIDQNCGFPQCIGIDSGTGGSGVLGGIAIGMFQAGNASVLGNVIEKNSGIVSIPGSPEIVYGSPAITIFQAGNATILIQANTLRHNLTGALVFMPISGSANAKLRLIQNLIYNSGNLKIAGDPTSSVIETNNTILNNSEGIDDVQEIAGSLGPSEIENNLFVSSANAQAPILVCFANTNPSQISIKNNDIFPAIGTEPGLPPCSNLGTGNLFTDPLFVNPAIADFHTQRTSPAVASGDINAPLIPPTDFDGKNRTVCGTIDMGVYEVHPIPPIALSSTPNPSVGGSSVSLSAGLTGNCNTPTGTLTFLDGANPLSTVPLSAQATATYSTAALTVGAHTLTATYPGDFNFDPSTSTLLTQVVTGYPTTTSLQVSPNPATAFQAITFSATVSSQFGIPNGTISFYSGSTLLTSTPVSPSGFASATLSTLGAGIYSITAVYNPSVLYASSTSPSVSLVVNGAATTTTLTSQPNPSAFGQNVSFTAIVAVPQSSTAPTGTVSFREGTTTLGSSPLSSAGIAAFSTSSLAVGTHTIAAYYVGSPNDNASSSTPILQVVGLASTTVSLTSSLNPANLGQAVTFVATVIPSLTGLPAPSGAVTFTDQFGTLGVIALTNGQAVLTSSTLTAGTHNIVATFAASGNYAGNSGNLAEVIQSHDFALSLSQPTITVPAGMHGQVNVILTSIGNFSGPLSLTGGPMPQYGSLSFSPDTVSVPQAGTATAVLALNTSQLPPGTVALHISQRPGRILLPLSMAAFAVFPLALFRRRRLPVLYSVLLAAILTVLSTGCTTIEYALNHVAPGTYTIPVTATDPATQTTHSVSLTLVVT